MSHEMKDHRHLKTRGGSVVSNILFIVDIEVHGLPVAGQTLQVRTRGSLVREEDSYIAYFRHV
jgi:hypothetical protein